MKQVDDLKKHADIDNNVSEKNAHSGESAIKLTDACWTWSPAADARRNRMQILHRTTGTPKMVMAGRYHPYDLLSGSAESTVTPGSLPLTAGCIVAGIRKRRKLR